MINNNSQKGLAMPMVIGMVVLVIIVGGVVYFANQEPSIVTNEVMEKKDQVMEKKDEVMMEKKDEVMMKKGDVMIKEENMMKKDGEVMMEKDFNSIISKANSIILKDSDNFGATGTAWLGVYNGKTYHRILTKNMPALSGNNFYEGWLVRTGLNFSVFSTGRLKYDPITKEANLDFIAGGDKSDHRFVVVTVEPDDGNPKPDKHVVEASFDTKTNLIIVLDAMMDKKNDVMMKKDGEVMMTKYTGTVLAGKSAPLLDFTKSDYDMAIKSDKLVVLYFYASWCPLCKIETAQALYPAFNELTTDKVVGFRVNYKDDDTNKDEEDLARQFGVPYQHTKVFVKNGQRILKSPESWDKKRYDAEILNFGF